MLPHPLVECVPNISEGRDHHKIQALAQIIKQHDGVALLDVDSDADHHRTVITFAGTPEAVGEAAFQLVQAAMNQIDLNTHQGVHPRMGALDVLPFVPLQGATLENCVALANQVGKRIGENLNIPVFLYEAAAKQPERRNLANVRKGPFETFPDKLQTTEWQPDYGPSQLHSSAGAIAVGARQPLIAFNVNLNTDNLSLARHIAKEIRHSSGGFPEVKALGFSLEQRGIVQVSMNMTNYKVTSLYEVFDRISTLASEQGITVTESEIVGLTPRQALLDGEISSLKLSSFDAAQVLESQIERAFDHE